MVDGWSHSRLICHLTLPRLCPAQRELLPPALDMLGAEVIVPRVRGESVAGAFGRTFAGEISIIRLWKL